MPIRELFISVPLIQESFASSNNVNDALVSIFGAINEDSFNYAVTDVLFKTAPKRSIMIDFKNEKMIVGHPIPTDYTFRGKMHYGNGIMRMDVFIQDEDGNVNKLLVDTGTLYSQYLSVGPQTLKGTDDKDSKGTIKMHNAKILPRELVGVGQKILGYNDLYHGYMYIDYDDDMLYINQN